MSAERSTPKTPYAEIGRAFGLYWVTLKCPVERGIGTEADYGPALTIWGARRRARRAIRKATSTPRVEIVRVF